MTSTIHLVGANGQIGKVLYQHLKKNYTVYSYTHRLKKTDYQIKYDITIDEPDVLKLSDNLNIVIFLSSNTNVDNCSKDPNSSNKMNLFGPIKLFKYLTKKNVKLIYFSSDAVFNGKKKIFYED